MKIPQFIFKNHRFNNFSIYILGQEETNTINNFGKISDKIILGNIVERKLDFIEFNPNHEINNEESSKTGFPTVFKLPEVVKYFYQCLKISII